MNDVIKCPRCENVIGRLVKVGELTLLQMGGGLCREWHGVCVQCGFGLHWSTSEQVLSSLVKKVLQYREK